MNGELLFDFYFQLKLRTKNQLYLIFANKLQRRETGDGSRKTEDRRRETGDGSPKTEDRSPKTGDRRRNEFRMLNIGFDIWDLECWKIG